jgi:hypothetical protein
MMEVPMATFRVEAQVSSDDLLKAVNQLSTPELERFVSDVITLQAQRKAPHLSESETDLLLKINQGIPADIRERYDELIAKRRQESLDPEEHVELLHLTEEVEKLETQRVEYLAELARLRKTTLTALLTDLGIQAPGHA